jgi:protein-L-isoaspartate(D-aspartate) O-methyltransferase
MRLAAHARRSSPALACSGRARVGPGDRRRGQIHAGAVAAREGRRCARRWVGAGPAGGVVRPSGRSRVAAARGHVGACAALVRADERVGHSVAEQTAQERRGAAAGAAGEDRGARAARAPSLRAAARRDALRAREDLIPSRYRDHAYQEIPLPLPGERATISCPHSYPLFYEPLGLGEGHRFLEVGVGSGYGTALAREVVGPEGLVVAIDLDATTLAFARKNLERAGYTDVVLVHGDGGLGYAEHAAYDRICVTAACPDVPPPLIDQLAARSRLIAPVTEGERQLLTLLEKTRTAFGARSSPTCCTCRCGDATASEAIRTPEPAIEAAASSTRGGNAGHARFAAAGKSSGRPDGEPSAPASPTRPGASRLAPHTLEDRPERAPAGLGDDDRFRR